MIYNMVSISDWAATDSDDLDRDASDMHGCTWALASITGWFDSPGVRAEPIARPGADGDWDGLPTQSSRLIIIEGTVKAPSGYLLQHAMERVGSLLAGSRRYDTLVVDERERGIARQATVRLFSGTKVQRLSECLAAFSMSLLAADPRRYSSQVRTVRVAPFSDGGGFGFDLSFDFSFGDPGSPGTGVAINSGSRATPLRLVVPAGAVRPSIRMVGSDDALTAELTVPAGYTLDIDTGVRSVLLGGASRRQFLSADGFFLLPPGVSTIYYATDAGDDPLTIQWRDAW